MLFKAEKAKLSAMLQFVREIVDDKKVEVACEEVLFNIISYAATDQIEIVVDGSTIVVKDWGSPFNPLEEAPDVDPDASLQERSIGGLGVFLTSQIVRSVNYQRVGDANILTLKFR